MKFLFKVTTTFRNQSFVYYVYAKSKCHAFNLVIRHLVELYSDTTLKMSDFSNTSVDHVLNFLK